MNCNNCNRVIDGAIFIGSEDEEVLCAACYIDLYPTCCNCGERFHVDKLEDGHCEECHSACFTECADCGEFFHNDNGRISVSGDFYCEDCYDEQFTRCENCGCELLMDDMHGENGECLCESCYDQTYTTCDSCSDTIRREYSCSGDNGNDYCESCYNELYSTCENCGRTVDREETYCNDDGEYYCSRCELGRNEYWQPKRFVPGVSRVETNSDICFGVELETSSCPNHTDIKDKTIFGCKADGSITGKEFVSPILSTDKGLDAIREFCSAAAGFSVDNKCGFHLHIDMRGRSVEELQAIAYAYHLTYKFWASVVPSSRRKNSYCGEHHYNREELENCGNIYAFQTMARQLDRYTWINLAAFNSHSTFEVRLHTSTLNGVKVCNWVKAHLFFVEYVKGQTLDQLEILFNNEGCGAELWGGMATILGEELTEFYNERAAQFSKQEVEVE